MKQIYHQKFFNLLKNLSISLLDGLLLIFIVALLTLLTWITIIVPKQWPVDINYLVHINSDYFPIMQEFNNQYKSCAAFINTSDVASKMEIIDIEEGKEKLFIAKGTLFSFADTDKLLSRGSIYCIDSNKVDDIKKHFESNHISFDSKKNLADIGIQPMNFAIQFDENDSNELLDYFGGITINKNVYFYFVPKSKMTPDVLAFLKSKKAYFITKEGNGQKMYEPDFSWKYEPKTLPDPVPVVFYHGSQVERNVFNSVYHLIKIED